MPPAPPPPHPPDRKEYYNDTGNGIITRRPGTVWSTTHLEEGRQERDLTEKLIQETSITPRAATSTHRGT